jgi:hypothetical protein
MRWIEVAVVLVVAVLEMQEGTGQLGQMMIRQ